MTRTNTFIAIVAAFFMAQSTTQTAAAMQQQPAPVEQSFRSKAWNALSGYSNTRLAIKNGDLAQLQALVSAYEISPEITPEDWQSLIDFARPLVNCNDQRKAARHTEIVEYLENRLDSSLGNYSSSSSSSPSSSWSTSLWSACMAPVAIVKSFVNTIVIKPLVAAVSYCKNKVLSWFDWKQPTVANEQQALHLQPAPEVHQRENAPLVAIRIEQPQGPAIPVPAIQDRQPALHPPQAQVGIVVQEDVNNHDHDREEKTVATTTTRGTLVRQSPFSSSSSSSQMYIDAIQHPHNPYHDPAKIYDQPKFKTFMTKIAEPSTLSGMYPHIQHGGSLLYRLYSNSQSIKEEERTSQAAKSIFLNFLIATIAKDQGFTEGMMVIRDPNFKIFNFLMSLKNDTQSKENAINKLIQGSIHVKVRPGHAAYERLASHFKHEHQHNKDLPNSSSYGIDFETPLFADHKTLLFGKLQHEAGQEYMYLKPEPHGLLDIGDIIGHAYGFVNSQLARQGIIGSTAGTYKRKEHAIDPQDQRDFINLVQIGYSMLNQNEPFNEKKLVSACKHQGYAYMVETLDALVRSLADAHRGNQKIDSPSEESFIDVNVELNAVNRELVAEINNFISKLNEDNDNLAIRHGNEVILTHNELAFIAFLHCHVTQCPALIDCVGQSDELKHIIQKTLEIQQAVMHTPYKQYNRQTEKYKWQRQEDDKTHNIDILSNQHNSLAAVHNRIPADVYRLVEHFITITRESLRSGAHNNS